MPRIGVQEGFVTKQIRYVCFAVIVLAILISFIPVYSFADTDVPFSAVPAEARYTPATQPTPPPGGSNVPVLGTGGVFVDVNGFAVVHSDFSSGNFKTKDIDPYIKRTLNAIKQEARKNNSTLDEESEYKLNCELQEFFTDSSIVTEFMTGGLGADFVTARRAMSGLEPAVRVTTGIIAWLAFLFFGIVTVTDILFIVIPPLHSCVVGNQDGKSRKPFYVSVEAYNAVKRSLSVVAGGYNDRQGNSKQVNAILDYLKHRTVFVIAFVLSIVLLASGKLMSFVVNAVTTLLQGFLDIIGL